MARLCQAQIGTALERTRALPFELPWTRREAYSFQCLFILFNYEIFIVTNCAESAIERHNGKWYSAYSVTQSLPMMMTVMYTNECDRIRIEKEVSNFVNIHFTLCGSALLGARTYEISSILLLLSLHRAATSVDLSLQDSAFHHQPYTRLAPSI